MRLVEFRAPGYVEMAIAVAMCWGGLPISGIAQERRGAVDLVIGLEDGAAEYLFHWVASVAIDAEGRIFVADSRAHEIRAYAPGGEFLYKFGRAGQGPGDLRGPCCIAIDSASRMRVLHSGNSMVEVFDVAPAGAVHVAKLTLNRPDNLRIVPAFPPQWDGAGFWLNARGAAAPGGRMVRFDHHGQAMREFRYPSLPPLDRSTRYIAEWTVNDLTRREERAQPFAAFPVEAFSPVAGLARAASSARYTIQRLSADGAQRAEIIRRETGPPVSRGEQEAVRREIDEIRGRGIRIQGFQVPTHKPVIADMWYDDDLRLWVELIRADGDALRRAHVYSPSDALLFVATWPADVQLGSNFSIRGDYAYGRRLTPSGVHQVVRLRFGGRD